MTSINEYCSNAEVISAPRATWPQIDPNKTLIAMPSRLQIAIALASGMSSHEVVGMYPPKLFSQWALAQADSLIEEFNTGKRFEFNNEGELL